MKDSELKEGDLCVAAYLPLQHVWKAGIILSVTEHGTYHVDCGDGTRHADYDKLYLAPHEVRVPPEGTEKGDIFKGDIFKKPVLDHFTVTVVPAHRVWTAGEYDAGAMHP